MIEFTRALLENAFVRKLARNASWQISDKLLRAVLGLFVGVWTARYLGPEDFGLFSFAIAFVALFTFVADLGLQSIVVRELVRREIARSRILASALVLRLVGAVITIILCVVFIGLLRPNDQLSGEMIFIVGLALVPQAFDVIDFDYQARMHSGPIVLIRCTSLMVFSAVKVILILGGAQLIAFAWAVAAEASLSAILMWFLITKQFQSFTLFAVSFSEMKRLIAHSWPLAIAGLSSILYMRIDQVMLGKMLGNDASGIFAAAVRISESWYFIPVAVLTAVAPALTAAHAESQQHYRNKLMLFTRVMFRLSVAAAVLLTIGSDWIIAVLYGVDYEQAAPVLALHAWAGVFVALGLATAPWFVNSEMLRIRMIQTVIGALFNIGLNLCLIPRYGAAGAAFSTLLSQSVVVFWLNAVTSRTRTVFFLQVRAMLFR